MYVTDKLVYIQLQKTGCSQITRLLGSILGGRQVGTHRAPGRVLRESSKLMVSSIRNPWDWYVSLWSYGCDAKGGFLNTVTRRRPRNLLYVNSVRSLARAVYQEIAKNTKAWGDCYGDPRDPELFRKWLHMVFDPTFRFDFGEGYGHSKVHHLVGIFSWRYLSLTCRNFDTLRKARFDRIEALDDFHRNNGFVDHWIRTESLEQDLIAAIERAGEHLSDQARRFIMNHHRVNTSRRSREVTFYYDQEASAMLEERERLIIEKFGYTNPPQDLPAS